MKRFLTVLASDTFRSLQTRNFRLWFIGQMVSQAGYWIQVVAQALFVLRLTDSGTMVGVVTAMQFLPMLAFGPWAGVLSDRLDKRHLLCVTQTCLMCCALTLGLLILAGWATVPLVLFVAGLAGTAWAFDQPARRTFVTELVPEEQATNAVSLNAALNYIAKVVGPALAALMIAGIDIGWCFVVNAASSIAVLAGLLSMDPREITRPDLVVRHRGQIRDGFQYVWDNGPIRMALMMLTVTSTLGFSWQVLFPLFAVRDLDGAAGTYALLMGAMSVGALLGSLWLARRSHVDARFMSVSACAFGGTLLLLAASPSVLAASVAASGVGATSAVLVNSGVAALQLGAEPAMRGRVMSLFSMSVLGGVAVGGPFHGWISERFGVRAGFAVGGTSAVVAGLLVLATLGIRRAPPDPIALALCADQPIYSALLTTFLEGTPDDGHA